nr:MAG TPA: hypothetical protein [Caudoviricetes sp.]
MIWLLCHRHLQLHKNDNVVYIDFKFFSLKVKRLRKRKP